MLLPCRLQQNILPSSSLTKPFVSTYNMLAVIVTWLICFHHCAHGAGTTRGLRVTRMIESRRLLELTLPPSSTTELWFKGIITKTVETLNSKSGGRVSEVFHRWKNGLTSFKGEDGWMVEAEPEAIGGPNIDADAKETAGRWIHAAGAAHEKHTSDEIEMMHYLTADNDRTWHGRLGSRKRRRLGTSRKRQRQRNLVEENVDDEAAAAEVELELEKKRISVVGLVRSGRLEEAKPELRGESGRPVIVKDEPGNILAMSSGASYSENGTVSSISTSIFNMSSSSRDGNKETFFRIVDDKEGDYSGPHHNRSDFKSKAIRSILEKENGKGHYRTTTTFNPRPETISGSDVMTVATTGGDNKRNELSRCRSRDISITQSRGSGEGIPQFVVQIMNTCTAGCVHGLHVHCGWFASAGTINPRVFSRLTFDDCIVNGGNPLPRGAILSFTYSNSFMYPLYLKSARFHPC